MGATLMNLVRNHPMFSWVILVSMWIVLAYVLLRPFTLKQVNDRVPFILCIPNFLLVIALMILPKAFPHAFEVILGHSIYSVRSETDWRWVERWEDFFSWLYLRSLVLGVVWAIVNLVRRRAWIMNSLALVVGILYLLYAWYMSLAARLF